MTAESSQARRDLIDEDDFRKEVYSGHKAAFQHVYELLVLVEESMAGFRSVMDTPHKAALSLILAKAFKTFDSIRRLCEIAHTEDAGILLRSLLNLLAIVRWISLDPAKRAARYLEWYWVEMYRQMKLHENKVPDGVRSEISKNYDRVIPHFTYVDKVGKKKIARNWFEPDVRTLEEMFREVNLEVHYDEGYRVLSSLEHSDALGYFAIVHGSLRDGSERNLQVRSVTFVGRYLLNAFQYFAEIVTLCDRELHISKEDVLQQTVSKGMSYFKTMEEPSG